MIIAAVLHLGSIEVTGTSDKSMDASEIDNPAVVRNVAQLLSVDATGLTEGLTSRSTLTRGEMIISPLSAAQARDVHDALVKGLHGRNVICIVEMISKASCKGSWTGVEDIVGMERVVQHRPVVLPSVLAVLTRCSASSSCASALPTRTCSSSSCATSSSWSSKSTTRRSSADHDHVQGQPAHAGHAVGEAAQHPRAD